MAVAHANEKAPEVYNGVSEADVPSARFGWSEQSRGTIQAAGWVSVLVLIAYNFGNHKGHVETIWLIAIAVLIALGLILHATQPKLNQKRTVTAHNKPQGHVEPDWCYDQKTLSGAYANLDERQLRALNIDPARIQHLRAPQQAVAAGDRHATAAGSASVRKDGAVHVNRADHDVEVVEVTPRGKHAAQ
ncbi:hypothetical protein CKJ80_06715 [Corynebacterium hadale]|uniref:DUF2631 domain-containing protein n=1 Tax=Corynebacterium hadale TaxID=2026255 RepID=A0AB36RNL2_9CORY|nr:MULTISPECIES: DUF2631 domain-containing protein [Corynebacterium]MCG7253558.1 DUF2631 domain-containing protein [Corynebacterium hadale]MCG7255997.1 DUF2631 domain-containing protein [Corynebacterium hadale]MCG7264198.1 DUF2631 domain-containing protein [Corynebacterium hadale]PAT10262.1 hypothetical protein CKJ80_06715 [Corynebacterium hadale]PAT15261.1 hypothetical protein CKJ84_02950 [Corynebacterium sp. NML 120412]